MTTTPMNDGPTIYAFRHARIQVVVGATTYALGNIDNGTIQVTDAFRSVTPRLINGDLKADELLDGDLSPGQIQFTGHIDPTDLLDSATPSLLELFRSTSSAGLRVPLTEVNIIFDHAATPANKTYEIQGAKAYLAAAPVIPMGGSQQPSTISFTLGVPGFITVTDITPT